jgi:hypothetical protein
VLGSAIFDIIKSLALGRKRTQAFASMRTYQPTVVIACLPQASVAQIAQISELPTVRGARRHTA